MTNPVKNIEVFDDTIKMIEADEDLTAAVNHSKERGRTMIYYGDQYPIIDNRKNGIQKL